MPSILSRLFARCSLQYGRTVPKFPPSPAELLQMNQRNKEKFVKRRESLNSEADYPREASLRCLYRIYQYLVLDRKGYYQAEMMWFWYRYQWAVGDIPDPKDPDPERYAILAVVTRLLVLVFNRRIEMGLVRGASSNFDDDELRTVRFSVVLERVPQWAEKVPPLKQRLELPERNGKLPESENSASDYFLEKNILRSNPDLDFCWI